MTAFTVFTFSGTKVRILVRDGEFWWVVRDVLDILKVGNPTEAMRGLDDDEFSTTEVVDAAGRRQPTTYIVSEAGLYSLIMRSRKPEAKAFRRWVTHEVLPSIRKTGRYESVPAIPETYADALQLAADQARQLEAQAQQLAVAAPKVEAWDHLATAEGDFAVGNAAKILSRHPLIKIGQNRLFTLMQQRLGWVYRRPGDRRWTAYQRPVESGWLAERPSSHLHPHTGELVLNPPQVRVTVRGLAELHKQLTGDLTPLNEVA